MSLPNFFKEPHILSGLEKSSPILLAFSGGADSTALLTLLCRYRESAGCDIAAAHLNHGIRGEEYGNEADRDEAFCRETCEKYGVELFVKRLDIPKMARDSGKSLETEARDARYAFFAEIMEKRDIRILATAHNSDDNLETQLQNLARGCGIDGMIGIPEVRQFLRGGKGIVIRPILKAEKCEIIEYCHESNIPYVTDSTNLEGNYTRNKIRLETVPSLSSLFPNIHSSAMRLSESAAEDSDFILTEANAFLERSGGEISISSLKELHPALQKRIIMLKFKELSDEKLEYVHIYDILSLSANKKNGASISLPKGIKARSLDGKLIFTCDDCGTAETRDYKKELSAGLNLIEGTDFSVYIGDEPACSPTGYAVYAKASINHQGARRLYAKNRSAGASITDGGVNKKIKKLMCDKKVPLLDRGSLPIIYSENEAVYVPLCAVSDTAKAKHSDTVTHITIYKQTTEEYI